MAAARDQLARRTTPAAAAQRGGRGVLHGEAMVHAHTTAIPEPADPPLNPIYTIRPI
jgi:hypothetical protein